MIPLKKAREDAGLTQRSLSISAGLDQNHYSKIERGEHSPRLSVAQAIAKALNLSTDQIEWPSKEEPADDHQ